MVPRLERSHRPAPRVPGIVLIVLCGACPLQLRRMGLQHANALRERLGDLTPSLLRVVRERCQADNLVDGVLGKKSPSIPHLHLPLRLHSLFVQLSQVPRAPKRPNILLRDDPLGVHGRLTQRSEMGAPVAASKVKHGARAPRYVLVVFCVRPRVPFCADRGEVSGGTCKRLAGVPCPDICINLSFFMSSAHALTIVAFTSCPKCSAAASRWMHAHPGAASPHVHDRSPRQK